MSAPPGTAEPAVRLRPLTMDDWPAVHAWARLPQVSRFQTWGPNTEDQTRAFVAQAVAGGPDRLMYAAELDSVVRGVGELLIHDRTHRAGEIRYVVHPDLWGRGLGTAIGARLVRLAFDEHGLHRVFATCDPRNAGSAGVLRKLGMRYECRMRHTHRLADGWRDSDLYAVCRDEGSEDEGSEDGAAESQ